MKEEDIKKMWDIDSKYIIGDPHTKEEDKFYQEHLQAMKEEMRSNYDHWYHKI